jgi:hypothetical protein
MGTDEQITRLVKELPEIELAGAVLSTVRDPVLNLFTRIFAYSLKKLKAGCSTSLMKVSGTGRRSAS